MHSIEAALSIILASACSLRASNRRTARVRWAALVLMVGTAFKIIFMDLWRLGQLYRVASFIGLAAVLILVSFLYKRFMTGKDEEEKVG